MTTDFLNELNEPQYAAVTQVDGASLVIAGAGSGKTRVLTYRIAYLLSKNVAPWEIMALTFTNKAAKEMKERIGKLVGNERASKLVMGTFHSIFAKILRQEAHHLNYPSSFTIYDTQDAKNLIKSIVKELKLDPQTYKINDIASKISSAKNNLITATGYEGNAHYKESDRQAKMPEVARIYKIYQQRCMAAKSMDFDDLLLNMNILLRDVPEVLEKYQNKYKYILVDEYQDTNFSQYLAIKKLCAKHQNLCVVGDDAQSIYSFRGAQIENILNFRNDYKNYKLFKLEQNYRSTQTIVEAANSIISKNRNQIKKDVYSENEVGSKIIIKETVTDQEEAYIVSNEILDLRLRDHYDFSEFAILYRTNAQSRVFEEALRKRNIPYRIFGGLSFYQRKEVKDLLAYCRLIVNPADNESVKRVINYPKRQIGDTTVDKLEEAAAGMGISIWELLHKPEVTTLGIAGKTAAGIKKFIELIESFQKKLNSSDAFTLATELNSASGLNKEIYEDKTPEGISRYENIQELLNGIREFVSTNNNEEEPPTLDRYLQNVSLLTNDDMADKTQTDHVNLMSIHSSKGLEFKNVFLVGVEEELFPSKLSVHSLRELEEERRLFYVAVTRAAQNLMISFTKSRFKYGNLHSCRPSRFLQEIDQRYIDYKGSGLKSNFDYPSEQTFERETPKNTENNSKLTIFKTPSTPNITIKKETTETNKPDKPQAGKISVPLVVGAIVEHDRFGKGKVTNLEGEFPNQKATIEFISSGEKQLLLKFAKLNVIG